MDEAHAAHVGGERGDFVEGAARAFERSLGKVPRLHSGQARDKLGMRQAQGEGLPAVVGLAEDDEEKLVGSGLGELVVLNVDGADTAALTLEFLDEVAADEAAGTADEGGFHCLVDLQVMATLPIGTRGNSRELVGT
jgi:hypothetical protein